MLIRSRRPKRNRYLQIGLFFIIYTCYHAYSAAVGKSETSGEIGDELGTVLPDEQMETSSIFLTTETDEVTHEVEAQENR